MIRTVKINNINVIYDIDSLISELNSIEFNEEYPSIREDECGSSFSMDENKFNVAKNTFLNEITNLDEDIEKLFLNNIHITKAGKLAKNRKNVLIVSDIITSYNSQYGSHQYDAICLVCQDNDTNVKVILTEISFQDSF
jgi:hypothetical protein